MSYLLDMFNYAKLWFETAFTQAFERPTVDVNELIVSDEEFASLDEYEDMYQVK